MRDYGRVAPTFWTGTTGRQLRGKPVLQVVAAYLFTSPNSNMIGLYYLPLPIVAHETGHSLAAVTEAIADLGSLGVAQYDLERELVFIPEMARFQIGETIAPTNKNLIKGVNRELERFEKHKFGQAFIEKYNDVFHLGRPLRRGFEGASKGCHEESETPSKPPLESPETPSRSGSGSGAGSGDSQEGAASEDSGGVFLGHIGPADPLTVHGLIAVLRGAISRSRTEIGIYAPGRWAERSAQKFLDDIPEDQKTDTARAQIRERAEAFAKSTDRAITGGTWTVEKFCENYAALSVAAREQPRRVSSAQAAADRLAAASIARYGAR